MSASHCLAMGFGRQAITCDFFEPSGHGGHQGGPLVQTGLHPVRVSTEDARPSSVDEQALQVCKASLSRRRADDI